MPKRHIVLLSVLLAGCDGEEIPDAGRDASIAIVDGGSDAGRLRDAGRRDAGDRGSVEMRAVDVQMSVEAFEDTRAAAPTEVLENGEMIDLALGATGIDALIGENGLDTLALSDATVRALADLIHASRLLDLLDRAIGALAASVDPDVVAVRQAAERMRDALGAYRDDLQLLFRERLTAGIAGTPTVSSSTIDYATFGTGTTSRPAAVVEGRDPASPDVSLTWTCELGRQPDSIRVLDEETGATLAASLASTFTIAAPFDEITVLRIVVDGPMLETRSYPPCTFAIESRRRLRAAPRDLSTHGGLTTARNDYRNTIAAVASAVNSTRLVASANGSVLDAVERQITMLSDALSVLLADGQPVPVEDLQRLVRVHRYVDAMLSALLASPQLAGVDYDSVRGWVGQLQTNGRAIAAVAAEP